MADLIFPMPTRSNWELGRWINPPTEFRVSERGLELTTEPNTDLWQRTYYGFRNDNAPGYLVDLATNFTFTATVQAQYEVLFDQAGVLVWIDSQNWIKASVEYENETFSRLGVVVTNQGHSDWSTRNFQTTNSVNFRVSRRGPDFLVEAQTTATQELNEEWEQLRVAHLARLGETTQAMGAARPPHVEVSGSVGVGVYACSPGQSSFTAGFAHVHFGESVWPSYN